MIFYDIIELQEYLEKAFATDNISLDLSDTPLTPNTLSDVATYLKNAKTIRHLELNLSKCTINQANILPLADILGLTNIQRTNFDLARTGLSSANLAKLVAAIAEAPKNMPVALNLSHNKIGSKGYMALATILRLGCYPNNFYLSLGPKNIYSKDIQHLCAAIESCHDNKKNLHLNLSQIKINDKAMSAICKMLMSNHLAPGLTIDLSHCDLTHKHIDMLANALKFGNIPERCSIDLGSNNLSAKDISKIVNAINADKCRAHLQLNLNWNRFGDTGAIEIARLLSSEKAPIGLDLNLTGCDITRIGAEKLKEALYADGRPPQLKLDTDCNKFSEKTEDFLRKAMEHMSSRAHDEYERTNIRSFLESHKQAFADKKPPEASRKLAKKFAAIIDAEKYDYVKAVTAYEDYVTTCFKQGKTIKSTTLGLLFDNGLGGTDNVSLEEDKREGVYHLR